MGQEEWGVIRLTWEVWGLQWADLDQDQEDPTLEWDRWVALAPWVEWEDQEDLLEVQWVAHLAQWEDPAKE